MQPVHIKHYFADPELLQAITQGKIEKVEEDDFAPNLFSCEPTIVVRVLPKYFAGIELLRKDTPEKPDPKTPHLQFERGAPTWLRLAWKCRTAYEKGGDKKITDTECQTHAKAFFVKYKGVIEAQADKKAAHSKLVRQLFSDNDFFTLLCGKPHAHEPYATNKLLARNLFAIDDSAKFAASFELYAKTLLQHRHETKLHPEIVEDLIARLIKYVNDPEKPARRDRLNEAGKKLFADLTARK